MTYDEFDDIQERLDLIELLQLIRKAMYSGTTTNKTTLSYLKAETALLTYTQGRNTTNSRYIENFRNKVEIYKMFGGELGSCGARVDAVLEEEGITRNDATTEELTDAINQAQQEYLSGLLIKNCDPGRYTHNLAGLRLRQVEGGADPYPRTLAKSLEMLDTWEEVRNSLPRTTATQEEAGLAYTVDGGERSDRGGRGRGGGGGGRGRGQRGGGRGHDGN